MNAGGVVTLHFTLHRITYGVLKVIRSLAGLQTFVLVANHLTNLIKVLTPNLLHLSSRSIHPWTKTLISLGGTNFDETLFPLVNPTQRCWKVYQSFPKLQSLELPSRTLGGLSLSELGPGFMLEFFCSLPASLTHLNAPLLPSPIYNIWQTLPPHLSFVNKSLTEHIVLPTTLIDSARDLVYEIGHDADLDGLIRDDAAVNAAWNVEKFQFPPDLEKLSLTTGDNFFGRFGHLRFPRSLTEFRWIAKGLIHPLSVLSALPATLTSFTYENCSKIADNLPSMGNHDHKLHSKSLLTRFNWRSSLRINSEDWAPLASQIMRHIPNIENASFVFGDDLSLGVEHFALLSKSRPLCCLSSPLDESCFCPLPDKSYPLYEILPNLVSLDMRAGKRPPNFSVAAFPASLTSLAVNYVSTADLGQRPPLLRTIECNMLNIHSYDSIFIPPPYWSTSASDSPAYVWDGQLQRFDHIPCHRRAKSTQGAPHNASRSAFRSNRSTGFSSSNSTDIPLSVTWKTDLRQYGAPLWPSTLTCLTVDIGIWNSDHLTPELLPMLKTLNIPRILYEHMQLGGFQSVESLSLVSIEPKHEGSFPPNLRFLKMRECNFPPSFLPLPSTLESFDMGSRLKPTTALDSPLPQLTSLTTRYDYLDSLGAALDFLTVINVSGSEAGIGVFVGVFPMLKRVNVDPETVIPIVAMEYLADSGAMSLEVTGGHGCLHFTSNSDLLVLKRLKCAPRSISLDPDGSPAEWLRWNFLRA